jgi:N-acyl-D-aspartate/D-glutamate deacylase
VTPDLVIRGGTVVDGTGAPGVRADVAVRDGTIVAVGDVDGGAAATIDAGGLVVAPGFVDIHTHYDAQVLWDRMLTISPWHGVTTVVMGNCGFGLAPTRPEHRGLVLRTLEKVEGMSLDALQAGIGPAWPFETFPEYLDAVERRGTAINVGVLLGHTPLRLYAMGEAATERAATETEITRMRALVREALAAGALGLATSKSPTHVGAGGRPVPSRAATLEEIHALAGELTAAGRGVLQATVGRELALDELAGLARATGRPVTWTALLAGMQLAGSYRETLERSRAIAREGLPVVPQVSCRPLLFEFQFSEPFIFESLSLFRPVSAADRAGKAKLYGDPDFRRAFRERADRPGPGGAPTVAGRWDRTWIASCPVEPALEERTVAEVAAGRGVHPVDLALDLALATDLDARFRMAVFNDDEDAVLELLREPAAVLGLSDAGAHASQLCDACFATHLLGHWVRDKGAIALEEAVRLLTTRPAEVFGIADRGRLAPGHAADVVVLDPATVAAGPLRRVRDLPAGADRLVSEARGIEAVIVNGTVIRSAGRDRVDPGGPLPGRLLRGGRARA